MVQLPADLNILEFKGTVYTVVQNIKICLVSTWITILKCSLFV